MSSGAPSQLDEQKKHELLYSSFVSAYLEYAFFGMIRRVDNSLMQLLGFCLAFVTAEAVITGLVNVTGGLDSIAIVLFLSSCCAFLISSLILLWAIMQRGDLSLAGFDDLFQMIGDCQKKLDSLYKSKHRKQTIAIIILFTGVCILIASILHAFVSIKIVSGSNV